LMAKWSWVHVKGCEVGEDAGVLFQYSLDTQEYLPNKLLQHNNWAQKKKITTNPPQYQLINTD
jgi:hypothetical protein